MRSGSSKGRPRISTAFTNVNTVLFTPMPSASAIVAASVNQRSFTSRRAAKRMSCQSVMAPPERRVGYAC